MFLLSAAPPAWWRPPLASTWLLDSVAAGTPPVGLVAAGPAALLPALIRLPAAQCLTIRPWAAADLALLPTIAAFAGRRPGIDALTATPRASLNTILWCDPGASPSIGGMRQVADRLGSGGVLTLFVSPASRPSAALSLLRLRRILRQAGLRIERTSGCLGPRALAWSALARLALTAGRPDRYDRYHAAMRAAFEEPWPWALACRYAVIVARGRSC